MNTERNVVIRIIGLVDGTVTGFDGEYVMEYDPCRDGIEPLAGVPMMCHLVTTPDIGLAQRFSMREAAGLWRSVDKRYPWRPDGKPNRPLTAFTIEIEEATT